MHKNYKKYYNKIQPKKITPKLQPLNSSENPHSKSITKLQVSASKIHNVLSKINFYLVYNCNEFSIISFYIIYSGFSLVNSIDFDNINSEQQTTKQQQQLQENKKLRVIQILPVKEKYITNAKPTKNI